ncbi:hypothetical protein MARINON1_20196 [Marinobacter salarius]|nr:hypothetical protein MBHK15_90197 [Marinobacter salarius]VXA97492.1 hypothetical protein MARINON1_20196 [Marinobacter salarius]
MQTLQARHLIALSSKHQRTDTYALKTILDQYFSVRTNYSLIRLAIRERISRTYTVNILQTYCTPTQRSLWLKPKPSPSDIRFMR